MCGNEVAYEEHQVLHNSGGAKDPRTWITMIQKK